MQPAFISEECGQSRAYRDLESDSHRNNPGMQPTRLSAKATSRSHGEDSPYFDGWREYDENPYDPMENPSGIIQMGLAENQLSFDLLEDWFDSHPEASSWKDMGCMENVFRELALYQDYHGLPGFRKAMAKFMEELRGNKVEFDPNRIVFTAGATAANELLMFCLADPGDAFLVPSPYYVGFDRDLTWRTGVKIIPVHCCSSDDFQIPKSALEMAYAQADNQLLKVRGLLITNPWNPLGTTLSAKTLKDLLAFAAEKNIHLVCDEIYSGSVFSPPDFVSIAEILAGGNQFSERVHIVCSLSKDLGLPGFRIGTIYSYNNAVVAAARRMSSFCLISSQTQHLLSAMLSDSAFTQKYIAENHRRLRERHRSLVLGLRRAGIGCLKSNAGLFCWADLRHLLPSPNLEGELKLWKYILHHVGLNISPGSSFHCIEPGWFRLCFANMDDLALQLSLKRLQHFVETRTVNTHKSLLAAE